MPLTPAQGFQARALAAVVALVVAVVFGFAWSSTPSPVPASASAAEFSSARARVHIDAIARAPHRMGSTEHERVRGYIVDRLRALGLEPEVQEVTVNREAYRPPRFAAVKNVVARRRGTASEKALLLVAHYDSRAMTPGASDDGYGVAALLETARALSTTDPPKSDVIYLFSDAEEEGLLGAFAFASYHPWAADVGTVLNFDARGNAGPVQMYQTGQDNGAMVRELARAAPYPVASSLSQAVYRLMPNDTDLSIWLPNMPSLNFANIGGFERYHAPTDTAARVDEGTLQHHGTYALSLARSLASHTLPLPRSSDASYFNAGPFFIHYAGAFDQPLMIAAVLLLVGFVVVGHRHGSVRAPYAAVGLAAVIALALAAALACVVLGVIAGALHRPASTPTIKDLHLASFLAFTAALAFSAQRRLRFLHAGELFAGSAAAFILLALLCSAYLPGAACLFIWPVLISMPIAIGLAHTGTLDHDDPAACAGAIAASCPALVIITPLIPQLVGAFGLRAGPLVGALAALLAASAAPAVRYLIQAAVPQFPRAPPALGAVCYLAALVYPAFGRDYPRPDTLVYAVDGDTGHPFWITPDPATDAWTEPLLAGGTRQLTAPLPYRIGDDVLSAPAPDAKEPGPEIVWIDHAPGDAGRKVTLEARPAPGAELLAVRIEGAQRGHVAGLDATLEDGTLAFLFYAPPAAGVEIALVAAGHGPIVVRVVSQRPGFPAAAKPPGPRPPDLMARPGSVPPWDPLLESDMTIVARASRSE